MRRWLRFTLIGAGGVFLAVTAAVAGLAVTFDPNTQRTRIIEAVRHATGRELVLAGPLHLTLGWTPVLEAEDAALSNRPGGSRPQMATVGRLQASVALLPLLSRRVEIESVRLDRPDILLETDAEGLGNWQFQHPEVASALAAPNGPHAQTVVALHRLSVTEGRITWRDGRTGRSTAIDSVNGTLTLGDGPAQLQAAGQTGGQAVHLDATLSDQGAAPWPLKLALDAPGGRLALDGAVTWPLTARSFQGKVAATIPDLADLGTVLGRPGLPPLRNVTLGLVLTADGPMAPHDLALHAGPSDLGAFVPGATLAALDMTLPAEGAPGRVTAAGAMPDGPWQASGGVTADLHGMAFKDLAVTAPGGDLTGSLALIGGPRWTVQGTLAAQRLDLDWLRALSRPPAAAASAASPPAPSAAPSSGPPRIFSDAPLPWDRLRAADADVRFTIGALHAGGGDYRSVTGHAVLQDGALRLDPFAAAAPEGQIDASLAVDAGEPAPPVTLNLRSAAFALDPLLRAAGLPGGSDAPVEVDVALNSAGLSPHALAAALDGHVGLAMVDGAVANAALTAALGGIVPAASGRLDPAGHSAVRCMALRLDVRAGQVNVAALRLDTSRLDLAGTGVVDLAKETLDLRLRPTVQLGGAGVTAPMRLDGALARPSAAMDAVGAEGRPGIVIGGPAPADDCAAALALARDGHAGRQPAAAPAKAQRPVDLLRSLLR